MKDPDAWLFKPQPTPELCRLYHGIDCRRCVEAFVGLDQLEARVAHHQADEWRREFEARERTAQKRDFDRLMEEVRSERERHQNSLDKKGDTV